jgi:SPP1 gp7 family putative phage head morphogenesis protein
MINDDLASEILSRELSLNRYDASLRSQSIEVLRDLEIKIQSILRGNLSRFNRTELNEKLRLVREAINDSYKVIEEITSEELGVVAVKEADFLETAVNELTKVNLFSEKPTASQLVSLAVNAVVQGAILANWWKRQAADTYFRISTQARIGYGSSQSNIAEQISMQMTTGRRNADALIKTAVHTVSSLSRERMYKDNSSVMKGKVYVAVLDNRNSIQCIAYDGSTYDMDNKAIGKKSLPYRELPAHFNCRSIYMPILKSVKEIGADFPEMPRSTRSSMDGQVPEEMTFKDFLDKKGKAFQDEVLGKGKAQLWRDGKITLQQLLDQTGNPIPLKELDK